MSRSRGLAPLLPILTLLAFAACAQQAPGTIEVAFTWTDGPPEDADALWLFGRVEHQITHVAMLAVGSGDIPTAPALVDRA